MLDGRQRRPHRHDLFAIVKRASADQQMRQLAGLERLDIRAGHVSAEALEAAEQQTHVTRGDRHPRRGRGRCPAHVVIPGQRQPLHDAPPALGHQPVDERPDRVRQRALYRRSGDSPHPVGTRHRQHDDGRLVVDRPAMGQQPHVLGGSRRGRPRTAAGHQRRERPVDQPLDLGHRAKTGGQGHQLDAVVLQPRLHGLVDAEVGTAKPVDRLLRVADDEQLARRRPHPAPVALCGVVGCQQQQDFRLQRVGVLELVDEDAGETPLKIGAHVGVVPHQVAGRQQQVDEVEPAGVPLEPGVGVNRRAQLYLEQRRQVGVGDPAEVPEHVDDLPVLLEDGGPRDPVAVLRAGALSRVGEAAVRGQLDERRLDPVVVAPAGTQLVVLPDGARDHERRAHVEIQPVAAAARHPVS